jgi:hypothetical protein
LPRRTAFDRLVDLTSCRGGSSGDFQMLKQELGLGKARVPRLPPSRHTLIAPYGFVIAERGALLRHDQLLCAAFAICHFRL